MKRLRLSAALLILASPSYGWTQTAEGLLGKPLPAVGGPVSKGKAKGLPSGRLTGGPSAARFSSVLEGLQPEERAATRGATEMRVYLSAAPSVVLVVTDKGLGSGALISADGKIITNNHVIAGAEEVGVVFKPKAEGAELTGADVRVAKVIRRDEVADLALLQVSEVPAGVKPLEIGSAAMVQVGSDVHAIGHPTGQSWTYTKGIVSQIRKDSPWTVQDGSEHKATLIQTQTPINPGNSGGPLIDDNLHIIGINSFTSEGEGLNFAVSADDVRLFLARAEDRLADPGSKGAGVQKASADCKAKVLGEKRRDDGTGTYLAVDETCDEEPDYLLFVPDDEKKPDLYIYDDDKDGKIDAILFDDGADGQFDYGLYDTDANGKFDMQGEFRTGETEPFRYERIKEED